MSDSSDFNDDLFENEEQSSENEGQSTEDEEIDSDNELTVYSSDENGTEENQVEETPDCEKMQIQEELRNMSFEDLRKLKEKLGFKVYNEVLFGTSNSSKPRKVFKRENHNRPMEMSSKYPVPLGTATVSKKIYKDPRFDSRCGDYDTKVFKKNYEFVSKIRENDLKSLNEKLKETENPKEIKKLRFLILRMKNQLLEEDKRKDSITKSTYKTNDAAQPKFYQKKSIKKAHELVQQFLELKKSGKLDKHIEKRRKKTTAKDRKKFNFD